MTNRNKPYDMFLSYSHVDREAILDIADSLQQRRIRVWYDGWEMKPGDILRERINNGIEDADYFLVVLSENSLDSSWVRFELNSAMINEIEQQHVRVIPAILGRLSFRQLPLDLRAKYCLDFRTKESYKHSVDALTDLIQPERRMRKELLMHLENADVVDTYAIRELREYAVKYNDQAIQVAAIQGLEKIGGSQAILVITERVLDPWGVRTISRALRA